MGDFLPTLSLLLATICFVRAYQTWKLSRPGSGYKGITGVYWVSLANLFVLGAAFTGFGLWGLFR